MMTGKNYTVYMHIFPSGKRYIGCTRQEPTKRWRYGSGYKNQKRLYSAIKSVGWENIQHIIVRNEISEEEATELEKQLIKKYDTQNPKNGYNTKNGGQTFGEHSEEFLQKMHDRMTGNTYCVGRKLRSSHIEALRKANLGSHKPNKFKGKHIHTEERLKLFSEKAKERWRDPEKRKRYLENHPDMSGENNPMYGKKHSSETKEKIALKARGRKFSEETIEKMRKRNNKAVFKCNLDENTLERFDSLAKAAESVDGNSTNIGFCCRNKNRTYKGFKWRYADDFT